MKFIFSIISLLIAITCAQAEVGVGVASYTKVEKEHILGKTYWMISSNYLSAEDMAELKRIVEPIAERRLGFKADLALIIGEGVRRKRKIARMGQGPVYSPPSSKYTIGVGYVQSYNEKGRPFFSSMGFTIELDEKLEYIKPYVEWSKENK